MITLHVFGYVAVSAVLAASTLAAAEPRRVVVVDPTSDAAVDALRIQLADLATIEVAPHDGSRSAIDRAVAALDAGAAMAVVMEPFDGQLVITILMRHDTRARVQSFVVPRGSDAGVGRAVALKLADVIEGALAAPSVPVERARPAPEAPGNRLVQRAPAPESSRDYVVALGIDSMLASEVADAQRAIRVATGVEWVSSPFAVTLLATFQSGLGLATTVSTAELEIDDSALLLGASLVTRRGALSFGAHVDAGMRRFVARALATDGRDGQSTSYAGAVAPGLDVHWRMSSDFELRFAASALITPARPVYAVDGMKPIDLGLIRPVGTISLVLRL